jgi:selenobiotic family peptide radical SAM maturase
VNAYHKIFANCRRILSDQTWGWILAALDEDAKPQFFSDKLNSLRSVIDLPEYIVDLARLEWAYYSASKDAHALNRKFETLSVNPTLTLVPVSWKNLVSLIKVESGDNLFPQEATGIHIMIWRHPKTGKLNIREAGDIDLLALKIILEEIDLKEASTIGGVSIAALESALDRAVSEGLLISAESLIRRDTSSAMHIKSDQEPFLAADTFVIQWHITQACDLHCKHCYDRSQIPAMPYNAAVAVLDDLYAFCKAMRVKGQVTFTGGNPLLYPQFTEIYREAADRGFGIAILGNPAPIHEIEKLLQIAKPLFYQISLEGLEARNDFVRGKGHFKRSLIFLDQLRNLHIYTMVMLTLFRENMHEVLPLADLLRDRTDFFTFNRLSTVGEGEHLLMADPEEFQSFLEAYNNVASENPILGLKDNLINIIRWENEQKLFGGCTGYGCGAAFNFVALLPDGEVHACRKFPSPIGNLRQNRLSDIYHSELAHKYRAGSQACQNCDLNIVCRGCLAVTHSYGLDVFKDKDPFCFATKEICLCYSSTHRVS